MKRIFLLLLCIALLANFALAEVLPHPDEAVFQEAMGLLRQINDRESVAEAKEKLDTIASGYGDAPMFAIYAGMLLDLHDGKLEDAGLKLTLLKMSDEFGDRLSEQGLPPVDSAEKYIEARTLEDAGEYEEALEIYITITSFLDAAQRALSTMAKVQGATPSPSAPEPASDQTPAPSIPVPGGDFWYLDEADVLDVETEGLIFYADQNLYTAREGAEIVVVTVASTGDLAIDEYCYQLMNQWGIGGNSRNGMLVLLAIEDEAYYTMPGSSVSAHFTPDHLRELQERYLEEAFAAKNYDEGVRAYFGTLYGELCAYLGEDLSLEEAQADLESYLAEEEPTPSPSPSPSPAPAPKPETESAAAIPGVGSTGVSVDEFLQRFQFGMNYYLSTTNFSATDAGADESGNGRMMVDDILSITYKIDTAGEIITLTLDGRGDGTTEIAMKQMYAVASALYGFDPTYVAANGFTDVTTILQGGTYTANNFTATGRIVNSTGTSVTYTGTGNVVFPANRQEYEVGSIVKFGRYEQDGMSSNGGEEIEWIVLDRDGDKALLISRYGLDCRPYTTDYLAFTWEACTLRKWLNEDFLNEAFTREEQAAILVTDVDNGKSQGYSGWKQNVGKDAQDKLFLLSYAEAGVYFGNDAKRICAPTDYAVLQGAWTHSSNKVDSKAAGWWWLRSPGDYSDNAASVGSDGSRYSCLVYNAYGSVRPALWIDLEAQQLALKPTPSPSPASAPKQEFEVGSIVRFGRYEQEGVSPNSPEEIEWIVLDTEGDKALLISRYGLDAKPYNTELKDITWESCTLRKWLNEDFLNVAFTEEEQAAIMLTDVDNSKSQGYSGWKTSGNNTRDKLFLLSYAESETYFASNSERRCILTDYAIQQVGWEHCSDKVDGRATGSWWLRSPGFVQNEALFVSTSGLNCMEFLVSREICSVRPVLWVDLEAQQLDVMPAIPPTPVPKPGFEVGAIVKFGRYEQDGVSSNGPEEIEWIVLDADGDMARLISRYGLDSMPYNAEFIDVTWETCTLRKWLNDDFLNAAFTQEEQAKLATVTVPTRANPLYDTDPGRATQDKVYLLSIDDSISYFRSDRERECRSTEYAEKQGVYSFKDGTCLWWLRSPGYSSRGAAYISDIGSISYSGDDVNCDDFNAVRPVIVLRLSD